MKKIKRLFLFAGYDPNGVINSALVYYINTLQLYGDVVLCMDNKFNKHEIKKLKMHPLSVFITRHKEYDFGSYKRAFQYAKSNNILKDYDYVYLVNDSVFGPMFNIKKILNKIETAPFDACGMVVSSHKTHEFMESWFVRLNKKIFMSQWFDEFISSVKKEPDKNVITIKYEHGLTNLIKNNGCSWGGLFTVRGRKTYNNPKYLFKHGCPFVKKTSFTRHNGALGKQIKYILKHSDESARNVVIKTVNHLYGKEYLNRFLTSNPIKILWRNIKYGITKLKNNKS